MGRAWRRWITIGIRREEKSGWESRAPLAPSQVASLKQDFGVKFVVQPSNTRVFANQEYQSVLLPSLIERIGGGRNRRGP